MDWESKWDIDNFISFAIAEESPRKLPFSDLIIDNDDTGVDSRSLFNLSMGSNSGHASATKNSLSASLESSTRDGGIQNPSFMLLTSEESPRNSSVEILMKDAEVPSLLAEASVDAVEPLIGLKFGKRTYFKNTGSSSSVKMRTKSSNPYPNHTPRCIVESCSSDLSSAKGYHRKHRVCEYHSKCFKVVIAGAERRFCQQCSRFHNLSEFDDKKRSCRQRLYDHNARRRKPQLENFHMIPFHGWEQMSFQLINGSSHHSREFGSRNSMFTHTRGYSTKTGRGSNETSNFSQLEISTEHLARSLLSSNCCNSGLESVPVHYQSMASSAEPMLHGVDEHLPVTSHGEFLLQGQEISRHSKIQVFRPFESNFYTHTLN